MVSRRSQWGQVAPYPTAAEGHAESGDFISSQYSVVEEISSCHDDVYFTLLARTEVFSH